MKSLILFFAATTLISVSAHADINGSWTGSFATVDNSGNTAGNVSFQLGITADSKTVSFSEPEEFTYLDGLTLSLNAGVLSFNGHDVGTVTGNTLAFTLSDDIDGISDQYTIVVNADGSVLLADHISDLQGDWVEGTSTGSASSTSVKSSHNPSATRLMRTLLGAIKH